MCETHDSIEESTSRMVAERWFTANPERPFREFATLMGIRRPGARPGRGFAAYSEMPLFEIGNTHGDSTSRAAKRLTLSRNRSRACRFCRVLSVRWGARLSVPRAARCFCAAGPQNRRTFESQVARFACGTPILPHWTAKTRHHGGPEAPGGGRRQATGARTGKKHLRNRHLSMVLGVKVTAGVPPALGPHLAALRPTVESAYHTQPGRPAFHTCRPTPPGKCGIGSPTTAIFTMNSVNN